MGLGQYSARSRVESKATDTKLPGAISNEVYTGTSGRGGPFRDRDVSAGEAS